MSLSNLCEPCSQILTTNDRLFHSHHVDAAELVECSCSLCKILCDGLRNSACPVDEVRGVKDDDSMTFNYHIGLDGSIEGLPLTIFFVVKYPNRKKVEGAAPASENFFHQKILVVKSDDHDISPSFVPSRNTSSPESWRTATHWLETCLKTHSKCAQTTQPIWVPTRLLDVGTQDDSCIRMRVMDQNSPKLPYLTLSHCWGKVSFLQLLQGNIESMAKGIKIDDLPKTFQDAVAITRRLSVRYLWIDSLCIIQKSAEDWARESSMMGQVYQNGLCNIAATGAPDGVRGCFMERDPALAQKCCVKFETRLSKFKLKPGLYDLIPRNLWENGLSNAPLNSRAWVAQERILAPRVLHFSNNQLFWECNGLDACEMYPNGAPQILSCSDSKGGTAGAQEFGFKRLPFKNLDPSSVRAEVQIVKNPWTISLISALPTGSVVNPYYVWNKILLAYTKCALTEERDKLVAISAVGKQIQTMANDEYLAGMWRRYLEYHLLWSTDQHDTSRKRPKSYVAPSWSWASMIGRIEPYIYIRPNLPTMIQILSTSIKNLTLDTFGQASSGHLTLRCWLKKIPVIKGTPKKRLGMTDIHVPQLAEMVQFDEVNVMGMGETEENEVWFLPIVAIGPWIECEVLGLMLWETERNGEFKRVGRFKANGDVASDFRRPSYPLNSVKTGGQGSGRDVEPDKEKEKKWWFGKKGKRDDKNAWTRQVITII